LFCELVGPGRKHETRFEFGRSGDFPVERVLEAAKAASLGEQGMLGEYLRMTRDENPIIRHWGAYGVFLVRPDDAGVRRSLASMARNDPMAGNRIMAAQALGLCGDPVTAFDLILEEANAATDGYVLLSAINAFQYSHTDDRLSRQQWASFKKIEANMRPGADRTGYGYARRVIDDALELWPDRRRVD
jgi:hypothetical protein